MSQARKWTPKDDEVNEEEEEDNTQQYQNQKDAILFAIDVSESMLVVQELDDKADPKAKSKKGSSSSASAVLTALQCAYGVLQSRIISNPNDMMGILLFGTMATKFDTRNGGGTGGYEHCYLLLDLDIPDAQGIKGLKSLIEDPEEFEKLLVPAQEQVSMANVLFAVNQIFTTKAANFQSRRLFIVTDEDDPHMANKALKNSSITRARDLYDLGVRIDPFFIYNPVKGGFDSSKFYDDIVYRSPADEDGEQTSTSAVGNMRLKEMVSSIKSKSTPKRALFTNKLELGPGLVIGVKGYLLYKRQEKARSHYVYTSGEKAQIVKGVTTRLAEDTAKVVDKAEIRKAYKFGGEQILFTPDEMKAMRNFGEPIVRIIGFKPASALTFDQNVKPANFIFPDETSYVGSTRVFAALHAKLLGAGKVGIAWSISRKNAAPQIVALLPSLEEVEAGVQVHPPGFFLVQLPFADDVRQNPESKVVHAPGLLIDKMRAVVKQLHMPKGYVPEKYSNPSLQWHYRILQAIALDEDMPEHAVDTTLPKYKLIDKHAGSYCKEWGDELENLSGNLVVAAKSGGSKRTRLVKVDGPPTKKAKAGDGENEVTEAWKGGNLNKLTVVKLKLWLEAHGLETTGKKADLVERVEGFLDA